MRNAIANAAATHTRGLAHTHTCRETVIYENVLGKNCIFSGEPRPRPRNSHVLSNWQRLSVCVSVCISHTHTHTRAFKLQQHWQLIHCEERIIMPWLHPTLEAHLWPSCQILLVLLQNILIYGDIWAWHAHCPPPPSQLLLISLSQLQQLHLSAVSVVWGTIRYWRRVRAYKLHFWAAPGGQDWEGCGVCLLGLCGLVACL